MTNLNNYYGTKAIVLITITLLVAVQLSNGSKDVLNHREQTPIPQPHRHHHFQQQYDQQQHSKQEYNQHHTTSSRRTDETIDETKNTTFSTSKSTIINNGVIMLGIHDEGHLNVPDGLPDGHNGITTVGLRYFRDGSWYESTAFGAQAEGYGVSAKRLSDGTDLWGGANQNDGIYQVYNMVPAPMIISDDYRAVNTSVIVNSELRVNHSFVPSQDTDNLYKVTVTYENIMSKTTNDTLTDLRYRRIMDWDIPPSPYSECVSIFFNNNNDDDEIEDTQQAPISLEYATDDGFEGTNPLVDVSTDGIEFSCPDGGVGCPVYDSGPKDHGALFQFLFKDEDGNAIELGPGETFSFDMFFGAASTKDEADDVLYSVDAEVATFGYPPTSYGCDVTNPGSPNVFIIAFRGVGGTPLLPSDDDIETDDEEPIGANVFASYFEIDSEMSEIPKDGFMSLKPYKSEFVETIYFPTTSGDFAGSGRSELVGAVFMGFATLPMDGIYTFCLTSDDGSKLYINEELMIDNDGLHDDVRKCEDVKASFDTVYKMEVQFFEAFGDATLILSVTLPDSDVSIPFPAKYWLDEISPPVKDPTASPAPTAKPVPTASPSSTPTEVPIVDSAVIDNGVIMLGIHDEGHLNVPGPPDAHEGIGIVGLRYYRDEAWYESTAFGSPSEGFGVSAKRISDGTDLWGGANQASGISNITPTPIIADGVSASTGAIVGDKELLVRHDFKPSDETKNLYQVTVTFENLLATETLTDLRYRRAMDWDIPPSPYNECVSIFFRSPPSALEYATDDGFEGVNPLEDVSTSGIEFSCPDGGKGCPVYDSGPKDHGAMFQFLFKDEYGNPIELGPGETFSFEIFYGAAGTKKDADEALGAVGAEIATFGYPPTEYGCDARNPGLPNVFMFGFKGVGGTSLSTPSPSLSPTKSPTYYPDDDGSFEIISAYPGEKFCIQPEEIDDRSGIIVKHCDGSTIQKWIVDEFGRIIPSLAPYLCVTKVAFDRLELDYCGSIEDMSSMFIHNSFEDTILWKKEAIMAFTISSYDPEDDDSVILAERDRSLQVQEWKIKY